MKDYIINGNLTPELLPTNEEHVYISHELTNAVQNILDNESPCRQLIDVSTITRANPRGATFELEIYANSFALGTAEFDVVNFLAKEISAKLNRMENFAFVLGGGVNQPRGILSTPKRFVNAQNESGSLNRNTVQTLTNVDELYDMTMYINKVSRGGGSFVMNERTLQYLISPSLPSSLTTRATGQLTLFGYPVTILDNMPDFFDDDFAVAFGNFRKGYYLEYSHLRIQREVTGVQREVTGGVIKFTITGNIDGLILDHNMFTLLKSSTEDKRLV